MLFSCTYHSPLGIIFLESSQDSLKKLYFCGQKYAKMSLDSKTCEDLEIFRQTKAWLECYFAGQEPSFQPQFSIESLPSSDFAKSVWEILLKIPYGTTTSYGNIAKILAKKRDLQALSAQAVGNAIARNPIAIIIPCHRVLGSDNNLTGYAGGIDKKLKLLQLENINTLNLRMPRK